MLVSEDGVWPGAQGEVHDARSKSWPQNPAVCITRRKNLKNMFKGIRYYVVDEFHRGNHKCAKKTLTSAEKSRFKNVRTNMLEVFNSWIRRKNFVLNGMNAYSHRFWVQESIHFWNNNLQSMPAIGSRRSTASTRKRPASSSSTLKRPAAAAKK